jgi:hypothetical protein
LQEHLLRRQHRQACTCGSGAGSSRPRNQQQQEWRMTPVPAAAACCQRRCISAWGCASQLFFWPPTPHVHVAVGLSHAVLRCVSILLCRRLLQLLHGITVCFGAAAGD